MQLPHDVRGLMPFHTPWWEYALWALGAIAVAAALLLLARYLMNRKGAGLAKGVDPWVNLTQRLRQLKIEGPFGAEAQEEFFYRLSLLVREGIELRTEIPATDRTFKELREPLRKRLPLATKDVEAVLAFLERADMIKFAGAPSGVEEAQASLDQAGAWLGELKPKHAEDDPFGGLPAGMTKKPQTGGKRLEMG